MTDLEKYNYELPRDLIAQQPLNRRSDARLLVVDRRQGTIDHAHVRDLGDYLRPADSLVLNDTRVLPARLSGYRIATKGRWSGLFVASDEHGIWEVMGKTRGKPGPGDKLMLQDRQANDALRLTLLSDLGDGLWAAQPEVKGSVVELLERVGRVPLPPYIRGGQMRDADVQQYQTVFAARPGAIAAPTAGLHFTLELLEDIERRGVSISRVTLHVGIGTFRPIATAQVEDHAMHGEWGRIEAATARRLVERRRAGGRVVAVGTTCVRILETAAASGSLAAWEGVTDLFIHPPYTFRAVDALLTNFHLPKSTLLILVRCFGGDELIRKAYATAIAEGYRFYSYGDAMLVL